MTWFLEHTRNLRQCTLLCPLYIIRWLTVGREMGLTVPSMNPKHWVKGEPLAWIAAEKVAGSLHTKSKLSRRWQKRVCMSSTI